VLFERFEDKGLAQYSYAVGCEGAGTLAIVDPRRDIDGYLEFAAARHMRITHVLETHIHADFASGARELGERTGAEVCVSAHDEGELYEVAFPHCDLADGERIALGRVQIEAVHTPGHTPEHLSFLVYDTVRTSEMPQLLLSGDFVFVGSLGRPDLIGEEAKVVLANRLFDSVQRLSGLADGVEVHPAHGAGSMCGAGMSARPMSTLGFERLANPYLRRGLSREAFVERILGRVPPFPPYYRRMKQLNARGARPLNGLPGQRALAPAAFEALRAQDHVIIDLRDQIAFGGGHIPGAFGIGLGSTLSTWASWVVPYETPLLLVCSEPAQVPDAVRALVRVGLDEVVGYLEGGMQAWIEAGFPVSHTTQESPSEVHQRLSRTPGLRVLDVRSDDEWEDGHVCGATHLMGGYLPEQAPALAAAGGPLAVICATGYRSTVAASVLERAGARDLVNVTGGMTAWQHAGLPTCRDNQD
jgi:hydroxyacylglutathione hydrolase